jgi:hypothetical protein
LGVAQHGAPIDARNELARFLDFCRRVTRLEISTEAVEHGRRDGDVTVLGEAIAYAADVAIDAENLLQHDEPPLRSPGRVSPIGAKFEAIGGGKR